MADDSRAPGYLETAFRERQQIAEQQQTEMAKEAGLLSRVMKDRGRADFQQQRKVQLRQVKHVARIGESQTKKPGILGGVSRGTARTAGKTTMGLRTKPQKTEGQKRAAAARSPSMRSAGGVAQLSSGIRWTAAGGQASGPQEDMSRYQVPHLVIDPLNPNRVLGTSAEASYQQQRTNAFAPGGVGGQRAAKGVGLTAPRAGVARGGHLALKAKQMHRAQQVKAAKIEEYRKRIAPQYGPAAADAVMYEWSRRQEAMYGEGGTGGRLTPALLFGNMEKPK